jgi:hypothetical protein
MQAKQEEHHQSNDGIDNGGAADDQDPISGEDEGTMELDQVRRAAVLDALLPRVKSRVAACMAKTKSVDIAQLLYKLQEGVTAAAAQEALGTTAYGQRSRELVEMLKTLTEVWLA